MQIARGVRSRCYRVRFAYVASHLKSDSRDNDPYLRSGKRKIIFIISSIHDRTYCGTPHREIRRLDVGEVIFSCPYCE